VPIGDGNVQRRVVQPITTTYVRTRKETPPRHRHVTSLAVLEQRIVQTLLRVLQDGHSHGLKLRVGLLRELDRQPCARVHYCTISTGDDQLFRDGDVIELSLESLVAITSAPMQGSAPHVVLQIYRAAHFDELGRQ